MTWAARRKLLYSAIVLAVFGLFLFLVLRSALDKAPTCFDRRQNGDEFGVDCGGSCARYCEGMVSDPKIRWRRTFPIAEGLAHAVAYIEHSNPNAALREIQYEFRVFDEKNELITTRTGTTFLGTLGRTAIIEPLLSIGDRVPAVTNFEINKMSFWERPSAESNKILIKTDRTDIESAGLNLTKVSAELSNQSSVKLKNIQVIAILYDAKDNAITASKTELPELPAFSKRMVYFSWPLDLDTIINRVEIIPRVNPFESL